MSRILVVEDSRTQAEELRHLLEAEGFAVAVAANGQLGLNLFQDSDFDLVLTDVLMPILDGYELCRRIKAHPAKRSVPVILLTTLDDPLDILRGVECGADNFLTKPYQADALLGRVRYIFANQARRRGGQPKVGVEVVFPGQAPTVLADQGQILDLLVTTCQDVIRANRELRASRAELAEAKARVEEYARRAGGRGHPSEGMAGPVPQPAPPQDRARWILDRLPQVAAFCKCAVVGGASEAEEQLGYAASCLESALGHARGTPSGGKGQD